MHDLKQINDDYLQTEIERSTQRKGKQYTCPICGSGTGINHTPALGIYTAHDGRQRWKCQACGKGGDIVDFVAMRDGISAAEATKQVIEAYAHNADGRPSRSLKLTDTITANAKTMQDPARISDGSTEKPQDFSADIARYSDALDRCQAAKSYLQGRGFTDETIKRFRLGYDAQHNAITMPYNSRGTYYGRRFLDRKGFYKLKGVTAPLFNPGALYNDEGFCFVVESELCAISITQAGGHAVAIGGTSGGNRLVSQLQKKPTAAALILCMDNDDAGRKATAAIQPQLEAIGYNVFDASDSVMTIIDGDGNEHQHKDPNEVLQASAAALEYNIAAAATYALEAVEAARAEADAERADRTGAGMIDSFLQAVQSEKYMPIPTGITDIDKAFYGGLMRQQIVMLGAAPGAGKTSLAAWIFENMAKRGEKVIFINLEMSRDQLIARSLSRIIAARTPLKMPAAQIMQGYKWTDEQRAAVLDAAQEYAQGIAQNIQYNPDTVTADLDSILQYIEKAATEAEAAQTPAPLIVIDYLQIIRGQPREDSGAIIKRAMDALKGYAIRHNTVCFVIMAHNRAANASGVSSMESGRDTSAIEYGADLQLALDFTEAKNGKKASDMTPDEKRRVTLKVNKGRFVSPGTKIDLYFDGETSTYKQIGRDFIPTNEPTPFDDKQKDTRRRSY